MNKDHRSLFETQTTSRFLSALRTLNADELPELKEEPLSKGEKQRIYQMTRERIDAYKNPSSHTPPEYEDAVDYTPRRARRQTLSSVAACLVLCLGLAASAVYFREDIGTMIQKACHTGVNAPVDTDIPPTVQIPPVPTENAGVPVEDTQYALCLSEIAYGGTDTAMVLSLTPAESAPDAVTVEVGRYVLSLWDEDAKRWRVKIDHSPDPHLTFASDSGFETMLVLDGHRIDENREWLWKLELYDITAIDATRNETKLDGFVSAKFNTGGDMLTDIGNIPESKRLPEDNSADYALTLSDFRTDGTTTSFHPVLSATNDRTGAILDTANAVFCDAVILEKWDTEKEMFVEVLTKTCRIQPTLMVYAADFGEYSLEFAGTERLSPDTAFKFEQLEVGAYRIVLRGLQNVYETETTNAFGYTDIRESRMDTGSVSALFTVNQ